MLVAHSAALARLLRQRRVAAVYANSTRATLYAGPAAQALGLPIWWALRRERAPGPGERLAYRLCDRVLCSSSAVHRRLGAPAKAVIINDGVPLARVDPAASGQAFRAQFGWSQDALVVGAVASLAPNKRHDLFIAMAERLASRFPQTRFVICGHRAAGVPPSYEVDLRAQAEPLLQSGRLAMPGFVEDMSAAYAAMDVLCLPSDVEGFGLVAVEAMLMGAPVVRTNTAGAEDMIVDGDSGFITPIGDLDALTDRTAQLLSDPELRQTMGRAGQTVARAKFTAERMAADTEALMLARLRE